MIWFTSDLHFKHRNVIGFCNRPYKDTDEMDEALIENWNKCVKKKEHAYVLGDFSFAGKEYTKSILARLNGIKHIVLGNHDRDAKTMLGLGFQYAHENHSMCLSDGNTKEYVFLSHFPYHPAIYHSNVNGHVTEILDPGADTRNLHKRILNNGKTFLLCGHVHQAWAEKDNMINVGVDVRDYKPVAHTTILKIISDSKNKL